LTNKELEKFFEEARIMANMRNPHIITVFTFNFVEVFEFGNYHKIPYLVMDYAPNGSLAEQHRHGEILPIMGCI
jgi:eukaryotic-like serine/threonine-protein kinase